MSIVSLMKVAEPSQRAMCTPPGCRLLKDTSNIACSNVVGGVVVALKFG